MKSSNGYNNKRNNNNNYHKGGPRNLEPYRNSKEVGNAIARANAEARRQEIRQRQVTELEIIDAASYFLDEYVNNGHRENKFNINEIKDYLVSAGYEFDQFKFVNQILYLLIDLANARRNKFIDDTRIAIRWLYIKERLDTMFMPSLHYRILEMMSSYTNLYGNHEDESTDESSDNINEKESD